jgi:hypothetical protein
VGQQSTKKNIQNMLAKEVYTNLENHFINPEISDEFYQYMTELEPFFLR